MKWSPLFAAALAFATLGDQEVAPKEVGPIEGLWPNCSSTQTTRLQGKDLVSEFNRVLQMRFASFNEFGVMRLVTRYQHNSYLPVFTPESGEEYTLACALQNRGVDAAILIAGRGLLGYEAAPASKRPAPDLGRSATLSEPIHLTGEYGNDELPDGAVLKRVAESAFREGVAEDQDKQWAVRGYAIVATNEACVRCHNGGKNFGVPKPITFPAAPIMFPAAPRLNVGDPIGVALYVSREGE